MPRDDIAQALGCHTTAALCSAHSSVRAMSAAVRPLYSGASLSGWARTAATVPGQNAAIHRMLHHAEPGDVLVVSSGGNRSYGPFGDLLATACIRRSVGGLVIDSTVRDTTAIETMQFPVFCLGAHPGPTSKSDPGGIDGEITCGEARVRPSDFIVGDADGVVVVPLEVVEVVLDAVAMLVHREASIRRRIMNGESTCDIFGIHREST